MFGKMLRAVTVMGTLGSVLAMPAIGRAALVASDNASDPAYSDGWQQGDDGGTGWGGGWTINPNPNTGNAGVFVFTSTQNGDGLDNSTFGGVTGDGDIDSIGGNAWGMYGNGGGVSEAFRPFNGALSINQTFQIDMDNGFIDSGGGQTVGMAMRDNNGNNRLEIYFQGGDANYTVNDGTEHDSLVGYGDEGMQILFLLTGTDSYMVTLTHRDGATNTLSGTLGGVAGEGITNVRLFNANAGDGSSNNLYFNNMSINTVPEPGSIGLLGAAAILALRRGRRAAKSFVS